MAGGVGVVFHDIVEGAPNQVQPKAVLGKLEAGPHRRPQRGDVALLGLRGGPVERSGNGLAEDEKGQVAQE